jgi:hypothetical protein
MGRQIKITASVENCIVCLKKATSFTGHVHKEDGEAVIAGFCQLHNNKKQINGKCKGCYGYWENDMGYDKNFGQVI